MNEFKLTPEQEAVKTAFTPMPRGPVDADEAKQYLKVAEELEQLTRRIRESCKITAKPVHLVEKPPEWRAPPELEA